MPGTDRIATLRRAATDQWPDYDWTRATWETGAFHDVLVLAGHAVVGVHGKKAVHGAAIMAIDTETGEATGDVREIVCDLIAVSGGWTPSVHLLSQSRG